MTTALAPGVVVDGKYEVLHTLGQGGMGVVLAARHLQLGTTVALKLMAAEAGAHDLERFDREARIVAQLRSEHVCRVIDVGRLPTGAPYIVMELLEGRDLAQVLEADGPLPVDLAVDYVAQACEALAEAHVAGVVHRDIKPGNLFVTRRPDGSPLVKVLDFGISKVGSQEGQDLTGTDTVIGSPRFMSPEQLKSSRDVDVRSDLWALGTVLYELCGGRPAFAGDSTAELMVHIMMEDPVPLERLRPDLPPDFSAVVQRCLAKDPDGRFENVAALLVALAPFGGEQARSSRDRAVRVLQSTGWSPAAAEGPHDVTGGTIVMEAFPEAPVAPAAAPGPSPIHDASAHAATHEANASPAADAPLAAATADTALPAPAPPELPAQAVTASTTAASPPPARSSSRKLVVAAGLAVLLVGVVAATLALRPAEGADETAETDEPTEKEEAQVEEADSEAALRRALEEAEADFARNDLHVAKRKAQALVDRVTEQGHTPPTPETRVAGEALLLLGDIEVRRLRDAWPEPRYTADGNLPYYDEMNQQMMPVNQAYFKIIPFHDPGLAQCAKVKVAQHHLEVARWRWAAQVPQGVDRKPYDAHRKRETGTALQMSRMQLDSAKTHIVKKGRGCRAELAALKVELDELQGKVNDL